MASVNKFIFVREQRTYLYLSRKGRWVVSLSHAASFGNTLEACDFCFKESVHAAEVVLRSGDPEYDVTLSLP
jgi:hypothetical protein